MMAGGLLLEQLNQLFVKIADLQHWHNEAPCMTLAR